MAGLVGHLFGWLMGVAVAYAVVLLVERLLGLTVWPLPLWTLGAVPLLALAGAMITYRAPDRHAAARLIDQRCDTKDLFLTAAMLERSPGQFQPLVARDAETAAQTVAPARVVPFEWVDRAGIVLLAAVVLAAGWLWLPPLDPFGAVAAREEDNQKKQKLADTRRATKARMAQLKKAAERDDQAKLTQEAIEDLKLTFTRMQPKQQAGNLQKLTAHQKELGQRWRKSGARNLANALNQQTASQSLGGREAPKLQKWQEELRAGNTGGLGQEMQKIQELARQAAEATDPVTAQQLNQELAERLKDLSEFAQRQFKDQPLDTALRRALEQFELARLEGLNLEALAGLCESMDLGQMELQQLAQSLGELMDLEQALEALKLARMLNALEPLDGEASSQCEGMGDYAELYARLLGQCAGGRGPGMGGPGQGEGNIAPEDESLDSEFQTTRARSPLTPGKILMSMKVKGLSDKGQVDRQYADSLARVKQDVSDAVVAERVPPGYHNAIKRYFDTLGEPADATRPK